MEDADVYKLEKQIINLSITLNSVMNLLIDNNIISKEKLDKRIEEYKKDDEIKELLEGYDDSLKLLDIFSKADYTDENKEFIKQYQDKYKIPEDLKINDSTMDFLKLFSGIV